MSTSHSWENGGALLYNSPDCPVSQQSNGYPASMVDCKSACHGEHCTVESEQQSQRAPDCSVPQEDKAPTVDPALNPNGRVTWRRTGQGTVPVRWRTGLSGAPIASSLGQRLQGGWGL
jgi:hypothetical protein